MTTVFVKKIQKFYNYLLMNTLGERLKSVLNEKNLSNEKAGMIAGVTKQAIASIVNGETQDPKSTVIYQLCKHLNVNMEWLLLGNGPIYVPNITTESDSVAVQELVKQVNFQRELIQKLNENLDRKERQLGHFIEKYVAKSRAADLEPHKKGGLVVKMNQPAEEESVSQVA
jgi:transcriptional regulator with XRE-family HTH domain